MSLSKNYFICFVFSVLWGLPAQSLFTGGDYLSVDAIPKNLCMVRTGSAIWSSCVIIGSQTVITTDHSFAHLRNKAEQTAIQIEVYTLYRKQPFYVRTSQLYFYSDSPLAPALNRTEDDETKDLVLFHAPELRSFTEQDETSALQIVDSSNPSFNRELIFKLMSQPGACSLFGVGARQKEGGGIDVFPSAHGINSPTYNSMSPEFSVRLSLIGKGITAGPGDSGGAYICQEENQAYLVGMIISGQPDIEDSQQQLALQNQAMQTVVIGLLAPEINSWLLEKIL